MGKKMEQRNKKKTVERLNFGEALEPLDFLNWEDYKKAPLDPKKIWLIADLFTEENKQTILNISKCADISYSLYFLFQMRFIAEILSSEEKEKMKYMYFKDVVKIIEQKYFELFKTYEKKMRRYLYEMFNCMFGGDIFEKFIAQQKKKQPFNTTDSQFFSFLLNTYASENAIQFRTGNYAKVEKAYLMTLRAGINNLIAGHDYFKCIDSTRIYKRWLYVSKKEAIEFRKSIDHLKDNLDLLFNTATYDLWKKSKIDSAMNALMACESTITRFLCND
jgi:hypothetical protein